MAEFMLPTGAIVKVDEDVLPILEANRWRQNRAGYPMRNTTMKEGGRTVTKQFFLHRIVTGAVKGDIVDHINGDILDNRRENLRITDLKGNARSQRKTKARRASQFKGVSWKNEVGKWRAFIYLHGTKKQTHLGHFDCEHAAGQAYNKAAVAHFGEFAVLNPVGFGKE